MLACASALRRTPSALRVGRACPLATRLYGRESRKSQHHPRDRLRSEHTKPKPPEGRAPDAKREGGRPSRPWDRTDGGHEDDPYADAAGANDGEEPSWRQRFQSLGKEVRRKANFITEEPLEAQLPRGPQELVDRDLSIFEEEFGEQSRPQPKRKLRNREVTDEEDPMSIQALANELGYEGHGFGDDGEFDSRTYGEEEDAVKGKDKDAEEAEDEEDFKSNEDDEETKESRLLREVEGSLHSKMFEYVEGSILEEYEGKTQRPHTPAPRAVPRMAAAKSIAMYLRTRERERRLEEQQWASMARKTEEEKPKTEAETIEELCQKYPHLERLANQMEGKDNQPVRDHFQEELREAAEMDPDEEPEDWFTEYSKVGSANFASEYLWDAPVIKSHNIHMLKLLTPTASGWIPLLGCLDEPEEFATVLDRLAALYKTPPRMFRTMQDLAFLCHNYLLDHYDDPRKKYAEVQKNIEKMIDPEALELLDEHGELTPNPWGFGPPPTDDVDEASVGVPRDASVEAADGTAPDAADRKEESPRAENSAETEKAEDPMKYSHPLTERFMRDVTRWREKGGLAPDYGQDPMDGWDPNEELEARHTELLHSDVYPEDPHGWEDATQLFDEDEKAPGEPGVWSKRMDDDEWWDRMSPGNYYEPVFQPLYGQNVPRGTFGEGYRAPRAEKDAYLLAKLRAIEDEVCAVAANLGNANPDTVKEDIDADIADWNRRKNSFQSWVSRLDAFQNRLVVNAFFYVSFTHTAKVLAAEKKVKAQMGAWEKMEPLDLPLDPSKFPVKDSNLIHDDAAFMTNLTYHIDADVPAMVEDLLHENVGLMRTPQRLLERKKRTMFALKQKQMALAANRTLEGRRRRLPVLAHLQALDQEVAIQPKYEPPAFLKDLPQEAQAAFYAAGRTLGHNPHWTARDKEAYMHAFAADMREIVEDPTTPPASLLEWRSRTPSEQIQWAEEHEAEIKPIKGVKAKAKAKAKAK